MIDPSDLLAFLNKIEGGTGAVDLLKIGQNYFSQYGHHTGGIKNKYNTGKYRIALDMEDCLDRFYGGYYSDWACGGQWNRAYQFVQLLINAFNSAQIEIIAFFDGTLKENKKLAIERNEFRQRTMSVVKHIRMIGTPPPKIWWLPPAGLRTCLRNALRSINIQVIQTVNDHTMELIDYFYENKLHAILGLHPDYSISNCSRFYSSHDLRLSYKGALETKEFMNSKLLSSLSLTPDHLPFIAVFLCGYNILNESILRNIYQQLKIDFACDLESRIRKIAEIVRNSPTNDIDEFIKHLNLVEWKPLLRESIEYYQRRGKVDCHNVNFMNKRKINNVDMMTNNNSNFKTTTATTTATSVNNIVIEREVPLASETNENDEIGRKILTDVNNLVNEYTDNGTVGTINNDGSISSSLSSGLTATSTAASAAASVTLPSTLTEPTAATVKDKKINKIVTFAYSLPGEVLKTALMRHQRGIMDPRIYQILSKKQILLPQNLEDEQFRDIPSIHAFYRPARQMIYAILFNLYHQKYLYSKSGDGGREQKSSKNQHLEIIISEWVWSPQNEYKTPELVTAIPLPWAVPTIQRLWFGMAFEDKQRRMKAFLTIMRSDSSLMLNRGYVPQHMLVMACVLRYIVTNPDRNILSRQELDAFLATAFSPYILNVEYTQELVLQGVHLRGIYLASLFMQGIETAGLANDACGVPLPWLMTNPWLFFDGKLFHLKLKMSAYVQSLRELCDEQIEVVLKIERFRKAILEDVEHYLLPAQPHMDPMYRQFFNTTQNLQQDYNKSSNIHQHQHQHQHHQQQHHPQHHHHHHHHPLGNMPHLSNGTGGGGGGGSGSGAYYNSMSSTPIGLYNDTNNNLRLSSNSSNRMKQYGSTMSDQLMGGGGNGYGVLCSGGIGNGPINRQNNISVAACAAATAAAAAAVAHNRQNGYQLKVGGIVVGSWAGGAPNRPLNGQQMRINQQRLLRYHPITSGMRTAVNTRLHRNPHSHNIQNIGGGGGGGMGLGMGPSTSVAMRRTIGRNVFVGNKMNKSRNRKNRLKTKKLQTTKQTTATTTTTTTTSPSPSTSISTTSTSSTLATATTSTTAEVNANTAIATTSITSIVSETVENDNKSTSNVEEKKDENDETTTVVPIEIENDKYVVPSTTSTEENVQLNENLSLLNNGTIEMQNGTTVTEPVIVNNKSINSEFGLNNEEENVVVNNKMNTDIVTVQVTDIKPSSSITVTSISSVTTPLPTQPQPQGQQQTAIVDTLQSTSEQLSQLTISENNDNSNTTNITTTTITTTTTPITILKQQQQQILNETTSSIINLTENQIVQH